MVRSYSDISLPLYRVDSWKNKKTFTESETVKECMLAALEEVVDDNRIRNNIISSIKKKTKI